MNDSMMLVVYRSLSKDDPRAETVRYMNRVNRYLTIDLCIKAAGIVLGLLVWPPFVSVGIVAAAIFTTVVRRGNPVGKRSPG